MGFKIKIKKPKITVSTKAISKPIEHLVQGTANFAAKNPELVTAAATLTGGAAGGIAANMLLGQVAPKNSGGGVSQADVNQQLPDSVATDQVTSSAAMVQSIPSPVNQSSLGGMNKKTLMIAGGSLAAIMVLLIALKGKR